MDKVSYGAPHFQDEVCDGLDIREIDFGCIATQQL